ncbi:MAG: enoyl-CoA hydratase/isomerase family protein [Micavibrio aeruginosavorus]|nr:enoyl-CoA hydratase/isomerase family protein [Micavibrio aeruginosavorus]
MTKNNMDIRILLNNFHVPHDSSKETLRNVSKIITDSFGFNTIEEILDALDQQQGDFAAAAAKTIRSRSPTSVKLTHAYYRKMIGKGFRAVTAMDYRLSIRCVLGQEFYEGIRAAVVDKDRNPRWNPARLEDVVDEVIEGYFADDLPDLDSVA